MKRQLQIKTGVVQSEWRGSGGVPIPPDGSWTFLDVTDREDGVAGDRYDPTTDTFTAPTPPPVVRVTTLDDVLTEVKKLTRP